MGKTLIVVVGVARFFVPILDSLRTGGVVVGL